jgi:3alpha(or 20beta)-hydroxysteroid dehydrogenase
MGRMEGKVAIVTGAARGMGESHARRLVSEGAKVALTDFDATCGEAVTRSIGAGALFIAHDVGSEADWQRVVAATESAFGPVSVLVNNAAIYEALAPIDQIEFDAFKRTIDINLHSVFLGMKCVVPSMRRAGGGSIINISSTMGLVGAPLHAAYAASKFGVRGLTKVAALDLADDRIRVNSIHPGFIMTRMTEGALPADDRAQFIRATSPMGRIAAPGEVSNLVLYLASDESSFSTGAEFIVDGGFTAR